MSFSILNVTSVMNKIYSLPKENKGTDMGGGSMEDMFHVRR